MRSNIQAHLYHSVKSAQKRWLVRQVLLFAPILILYCSVLTVFVDITNIRVWLSAIIITAFFIAARINSTFYKQFTVTNLAQHLNRLFPEYEESAQLLTQDDSSLSILQQLQKRKIEDVFLTFQENNITVFKLPLYPKYKVLLILSIALSLFVFGSHLHSFWESHLLTRNNDSLSNIELINDKLIDEQPVLQHATVSILPPSYTTLPKRTQEKLDITSIEGSTIVWHLDFSNDALFYSIIFSDGTSRLLSKSDSGYFELQHNVEKSSIYRIAYSETANGSTDHQLPGVYTIAVQRDKKPTIRIITPKESLVEIANNSIGQFTTEVIVRDDFDISRVEIKASVAKGSGEAVKFRDETFYFDTVNNIVTKNIASNNEVNTSKEVGQVHQRFWDLQQLGMEPGDEIYFTVHAWDNKQPNNQEGKSNTLIVRWLDDDIQSIAAEGILIGFKAEYFRSQRQIIIESEELLADADSLSKDQFNEKSYDLGRSQGDLKLKYGQYLGDENERSSGLSPPEHHDDDHEQKHDTASKHLPTNTDAQSSINEHDAPHEHMEMTHSKNDISGAMSLISQYGHNHEDSDIGIQSAQNPLTMMKKAVNTMWQAELHLMLGNPAKALPFEYEALKYLKLAKQAERIYVKRLGFEAPPVSEERRLSGDLQEIKSYTQHSSTSTYINELNQQDRVLMKKALKIINTHSPNKPLIDIQKKWLTQLQSRLTALADTRPVLLLQAATVEKILLANKTRLTECTDCLKQLQSHLWKLLPEATALPTKGERDYFLTDDLSNDYLQRINNLSDQNND